MADSFISILDSNNSPVKIDSSSLTVGINSVQRQRFNLADPTTAANIAGVTAGGALKVDISAGGTGVVGVTGGGNTLGVNGDGSVNVDIQGNVPVTLPLDGSAASVAAAAGQGLVSFAYDGTAQRRMRGTPGVGGLLVATGGGVRHDILHASALGILHFTGANRICRVINGNNADQTGTHIYVYDSATLAGSQGAQTGTLIMDIDSIGAGQVLDLQLPVTVGVITWTGGSPTNVLAGAGVALTTEI